MEVVVEVVDELVHVLVLLEVVAVVELVLEGGGGFELEQEEFDVELVGVGMDGRGALSQRSPKCFASSARRHRDTSMQYSPISYSLRNGTSSPPEH